MSVRARRADRGFSLVELMVVLSILLILSGMIMVLVSFGRDFARETRIKELLTMVDQGIQLYKAEYEIYPLEAAPGTNNLAYQLCHPDPAFEKTGPNITRAKTVTGFPTRLMVDNIPAQRYDEDNVDFTTDYPIPIYDGNSVVGPLGAPLLYIFKPDSGRQSVEGLANPPETYSAWDYAWPSYRTAYELWCVGDDGEYDERLHDTRLPENKDNITVTRWK